jgi:hypothetical protein
VVALTLVGVFIRSFGAAESGGRASPVLEIVAFVLGVWVPLFALIYACVRSRVAVIALAFCVGLSVNLVFVTHAAPAAAVTDNSSVFTFKRTTTFNAPQFDMLQNYTPSGASTTCPAAYGFNWMCTWSSDSFTTGQTMSAGTAQVDLYVSNSNPLPVFQSSSLTSGGSDPFCTMTKPASLANGDVMLAACSFRGGTGTTITSVPSGWTLVGSRVDSTTEIGLAVYSHVVTDASTEPASYTWNLSTSVKFNWSIVVYSGIDNASPIDDEDGQATASGNSHDAPSVTTTVTNDMLVTYHVTAICTFWTPPVGMTERAEGNFCSQGVGSNVDMETSDMLLGGTGPTGPLTATGTEAAVGVTKTVALRRNTAPVTCELTVQLTKPIVYRSSDSNVVHDSAQIVLNKPAGVIDGDVMITSLEASNDTGAASPTSVPTGWTLVRSNIYNHVYVKAASGEPTTYTWDFPAGSYVVGEISAYSGVDNASPVDVSAISTGFETMPSLTTSLPGEMLVASFGGRTGSAPATWTPPLGMTERVDRTTTTASAIGYLSLSQNDELWVAAGATGSRTTNSTPTVNSPAGSWLALRPAAGAFLGAGTVTITSPAGPTLKSVSIATPAVTFATGDRLQVVVVAPDDGQSCGTSVSYDGASEPSKLTVAAEVPEGVAGLLLLAPALPVGLRWWKRRQP